MADYVTKAVVKRQPLYPNWVPCDLGKTRSTLPQHFSQTHTGILKESHTRSSEEDSEAQRGHVMIPFAKFLLWPQVPRMRCCEEDGDGWEGYWVPGLFISRISMGDSAHINGTMGLNGTFTYMVQSSPAGLV